MPRILVTGGGKSGSWAIRGLQLGAAIGATVIPDALTESIKAADLVVLVKRPPAGLLDRLHAARARTVWDVVDAWPQPAGNAWGKQDCIDWLFGAVGKVNPVAIVAATRSMGGDCERFGLPVLALPHHARPGAAVNPLRPLRVVGYEGAEAHLGSWRGWLEAECASRGLQFICNPAALADVDIVVALREQRGYAPRHWKSGVKLANAQATGTPIICAREAGYIETSRGGECWADTAEEVRAALNELDDTAARRRKSAELFAAKPDLHQIANTYRARLESLC